MERTINSTPFVKILIFSFRYPISDNTNPIIKNTILDIFIYWPKVSGTNLLPCILNIIKYITINIKEPKTYKTEGLDILKTIPITPYEAVLGANISVTTINGKISVKLPPHTQNGQKIRLSNCGLVQNNKIGDMIVTVEIQIPKNLSNEELELYKKLEEVSSQNIRENL